MAAEKDAKMAESLVYLMAACLAEWKDEMKAGMTVVRLDCSKVDKRERLLAACLECWMADWKDGEKAECWVDLMVVLKVEWTAVVKAACWVCSTAAC